VGVRTVPAVDGARGRSFECEVWYPATGVNIGADLEPDHQDSFLDRTGATRNQAAIRDADPRPGPRTLLLFSHSSGAGRQSATFLTTHLASHGYLVAALDHSEMIDPALGPNPDATPDERKDRIQAIIGGRVPDIVFLTQTIRQSAGGMGIGLESGIGICGHSFGGWTALAAVGEEKSIRSVVALAPGGAANPRPGILPLRLDFEWGRPVPALFLVAEDDVTLPLSGMYELFGRAPAPKQMIVLRRADHSHFGDQVAISHESMRTAVLPAELDWLGREMVPIEELAPEEQAHRFTRGLALAHFDATLRGDGAATELLETGLVGALEARGLDAYPANAEGLG
jgi:dienelactone hydrolase